MCGIAGFVGQGDLDHLCRMTLALKHRGPDAEGYWHEDNVFLGHRRLSILDLTGGAQPMISHDGRYVTILNGEIYNYIELRAELVSLGSVFQTDHSDTEVFTEAYRRWGTDFHVRLNGMWAGAIYDRYQRRLLLTRDRFGKKPLYYARSSGSFVFASELSALTEHPSVDLSISHAAVQKYLAHGYIPAPKTIYSGVSKLTAGNWMLLHTDTLHLKVQVYWRFDLRPSESDPTKDLSTVTNELLAKMRTATELRLRADVPVGVFLSGGIDSTTVATLAAQARPGITSFSIGFEEKTFDETPFAMQAARQLQVEHVHQTVSAAKCRELAPEVIGRLDEPFGDPSLVPTFLLCKAARERVKVCLSGDGADELFAGYDPFRAVHLASLYHRHVPAAAHYVLRFLADCLPVSFENMSFDFKVRRTLRGLSCPPRFWNAIWMAPCDVGEIRRLTGAADPEAVFSEALACWDRGADLSNVDRTLLYFTELYLREDILTKVDRASMLNSLEVRCPFLDPDLVDYVRRLPSGLKLHGSTTKWIFKRAIAGLVPAHLANRRKKGFGMPVGKWFYDGSLSLDPASLSSFLDEKEIRRMLTEHKSRRANYSWALWALFVLSIWLNRQSRSSRRAGSEAIALHQFAA
jgi:asparagine synthase (glutamine-hydrolysing)